MKQGVFIERDGILNQVRVEGQHQVGPLTLEELRINKAAVPLLTKLKMGGLLLIATTNQPGLSRGYQNRRELDRMHDLLRKTFVLDDMLVCPHDETDRCPCRKPKPLLVNLASTELDFDPGSSFVIGDKPCDIDLGRAVGGTTLLVRTGYGEQFTRDNAVVSDYQVDDLCHAAEVIESVIAEQSVSKCN